jgi:hypothetical protein
MLEIFQVLLCVLLTRKTKPLQRSIDESISNNNIDTPSIAMSAPNLSNHQLQHCPDLCTVCAARSRRHQARTDSISSEDSANNIAMRMADIPELQQLATNEPSQDSPPPYSKRRRYQRLDVSPPTYTNVITTPPPGIATTTIPVTIRYTELIVLEDDGYFKVVCPTARKFRTSVKVYDSMDWFRFWECMRQLKPSLTARENTLKEVRGLRRKGKWERVMCTRFGGVRLEEESWEEMRGEMCSGDVDKVVVFV